MATAQAAPPAPNLYRPRYHFTPNRNWGNDPNGLVYYRGRYHLFFQYNPYGNSWGHMSWGHATSRDLVHWKQHAVAIPETQVMAFSGSAVVDRHNSSGLGVHGHPPLVALYTGFNPKTLSQSQYLAYSQDGGTTWKRYGHGPVLDIGSKQFRDPKVFWYAPTKYWVMAAVRATRNQVAIYTSPDLTHWTHASTFGPMGARATAWECPDLYPMAVAGHPGQVRWVLSVNASNGAPAGGSGTQYFVGRFDGQHFTPVQAWGKAPVWLDDGADLYATATWNDIPSKDGRRLLIGWANNLRYAGAIPGYPERGAMSLPRALTLHRTAKGYRLQQQPVKELLALRADHHVLNHVALSGRPTSLESALTDAASSELSLDVSTGSAQQILLTLRDAQGYQTVVGVNPAVNEVFIDRDRAGPHFNDGFGGRQSTHVDMHSGRVHLNIFVDRSIIEVFVDRGEKTLTDRFFPGSETMRWSIQARGGKAKLVHLDAWRMKPYRPTSDGLPAVSR
ncbi:glycoside hydrolase family 32 protein [Oleiagrimonas sp. C23AA]|uniref:glycoside hydrolase family 32 protein n=1 Tax=Oleiagrimonas sp. C23AA TaxID=2719047 RepID=UPI00141F30F0|nr:glycoside hydrolase family 32 protein [Oleiagrimonas sp. C23AA]NII09881.1 glycoside hydrolase family 32 protein [Oleiagrimonas sp. C23AA]